MTQPTQTSRAAANLHTAAAEARQIASERDTAHGRSQQPASPSQPGRISQSARPIVADADRGFTEITTFPCAAKMLQPAANPARVYCYWLGGKDHYPADRRAAEDVIRCRPEVVAGARANRVFGRRVTWHAASACRIRQFLDIGAGLPAPGSTHQTAQQADPACRVVYADNDPVVLAHARALLTPGPGGTCDYILADVRDPGALLAKAAAALDFTEPVAVLLLAVLHFLSDADDPAAMVRELAGPLAPGSMIAISHLTADYAPRAVKQAAAAYNALVPVPIYSRTREQVAGLYGGLPLEWPGVVPITRWRPPLAQSPGQPVDLHGGICRLPVSGDTDRRSIRDLAAIPPGPPDPGELALLAAAFPGFRIRRETIADRSRYVARRLLPGTRPHTVVTSSLSELRAELTAGQPDSRP